MVVPGGAAVSDQRWGRFFMSEVPLHPQAKDFPPPVKSAPAEHALNRNSSRNMMHQNETHPGQGWYQKERDYFIDNQLVRIRFVILMIRWTGLAPWECEFPFPFSLSCTFLVVPETSCRKSAKLSSVRLNMGSSIQRKISSTS